MGSAVQQLEVLIRAAVFKPAAVLVGVLLQEAADRVDASYQPKPGEERKGRASLQVPCLFSTFELQRTYFQQPDKKLGHYPADAALGLEVGYTPGLARLICLEGADEVNKPTAPPKLARFIWAVCLPSIGWTTRDIRCAIGIPPPTSPGSKPLTNSVRSYARKPSFAGSGG